MAELRLGEADFLRRFLEDPTGRLTLRTFFVSRANYHRGRAVEYLTNYEQANAMEQAFFANCYERGFTELESFCKEQMAKAEA